MCAQCMGAAAAMVGTAGGLRAWLAVRSPEWLTPRRMRVITAALLTGAVVASGISTG